MDFEGRISEEQGMEDGRSCWIRLKLSAYGINFKVEQEVNYFIVSVDSVSRQQSLK